MKFRQSIVVGAAILSITTQQAGAIVPLSAQELAEHCVAYPDAIESVDGQYCIRYVQGFIDGAIATDERVMLNVEADYGRQETFTERAFRTRHSNATERMRAARYAGYCLGKPVPLRDVVSNVVHDLLQEGQNKDGLLAREVVYASLRKNYACETTKPVK